MRESSGRAREGQEQSGDGTAGELAGGDRSRALAYLEKMVQVRLDLPPVHPRLALKELEARGYPPDLVRAVASHADRLGVSRETLMEKTLYAVDELSGFIMACAYVRPTGIHGLTPKSVKKKMKTPAFAAAVNRDELREGAEALGVDFDEHVAFVIAALEERADELELHGSAAHA
jgi:predicted hydrolase (HD superfamily)